VKDLSTIISELYNLYKDNIPSFSLVEGTVERDIFVEAPAQALLEVYDQLDYVQKIQLLTKYADELPVTVVDDWASQYNIERKGARRATTTVWFYRDSAPDADITIPLGTVVATAESPIIEFETIEEKTMYAANPDIYYDPSTNKWGIEIQVQAILPGSEANRVGSNLITRLVTPIASITSVNNKVAATGGEDEESNSDLVQRVLLSFRGRGPITFEGISSLILEQTSVRDSLVIDASHPLMERDAGRGRCVDVYIVGFLGDTNSDTFIVTSTGVVLTKPPVSAITSIVGDKMYSEGSDFFLNKDTGVLKGSTMAFDRVVFTPTGPGVGESITVTYTYNKLLHNLKDLFDRKENKVPNRDILMREATRVYIDLTIAVYLDKGTDAITVINLISTAISNYVQPKLKSKIERADIIGIVQGVSGVDNSRIVSLTSEGGGQVNELGDIILNETEFPELRDLEVQIA